MSAEWFQTIIDNSVSLAILSIVLYGIYKLTNRMLDVISKHIETCCESLERIADALENKRTIE